MASSALRAVLLSGASALALSLPSAATAQGPARTFLSLEEEFGSGRDLVFILTFDFNAMALIEERAGRNMLASDFWMERRACAIAAC